MNAYIPGIRWPRIPQEIGLSRVGFRWGVWQRFECYDGDLGKTGEVVEWIKRGSKKAMEKFMEKK